MERILDNRAAVYVWFAAVLAALAAMLVVGDARVFIAIWAAGGVVAVAVASRTRRGR